MHFFITRFVIFLNNFFVAGTGDTSMVAPEDTTFIGMPNIRMKEERFKDTKKKIFFFSKKLKKKN